MSLSKPQHSLKRFLYLNALYWEFPVDGNGEKECLINITVEAPKILKTMDKGHSL